MLAGVVGAVPAGGRLGAWRRCRGSGLRAGVGPVHGGVVVGAAGAGERGVVGVGLGWRAEAGSRWVPGGGEAGTRQVSGRGAGVVGLCGAWVVAPVSAATWAYARVGEAPLPAVPVLGGERAIDVVGRGRGEPVGAGWRGWRPGAGAVGALRSVPVVGWGWVGGAGVGPVLLGGAGGRRERGRCRSGIPRAFGLGRAWAVGPVSAASCAYGVGEAPLPAGVSLGGRRATGVVGRGGGLRRGACGRQRLGWAAPGRQAGAGSCRSGVPRAVWGGLAPWGMASASAASWVYGRVGEAAPLRGRPSASRPPWTIHRWRQWLAAPC
jgi:hypothetical protein